MDFNKLAELDNKLEYFEEKRPFSFRLESPLGYGKFKSIPPEFKQQQLGLCVEYLSELREYAGGLDPQLLPKVITSINQMFLDVKMSKEMIFDEFFIDAPDFIERIHPVYRRGEKGRLGYADVDYYRSSVPHNEAKEYFKRDYNKTYEPVIATFQYLYGFLSDGLGHILSELKQSAPLRHPQRVQVTDIDQQPITDEPATPIGAINYKVLLLHGLKVLEPLKQEYQRNNPAAGKKEFAKLIADIIGVDATKKETLETVYRCINGTNMLTGFSQRVINQVNNTLGKHNLKDLHEK